ncbi:MAG: dipeptidase [Planctomycetota bacterium]
MAEETLPFLLDAHVDTLLRVLDDGADLAAGIPEGHVDLARLAEAGVGVLVFSLWPSLDYLPDRSFTRVVAMAEALRAQCARHPDRLGLARTAAEARALVAEGRLACMMGVEGGHAIEDDLGKLRALADLGVRYMTLTWNNHLAWAESCQRPTADSPRGLTDFGREVVREMHRLGVVADCSHVSPRTLHDVLDLDVPPPLCSHSGARAVHDHCRNLADAEIEAVAAKGGAVGLVLYPGFLTGGGPCTLADAVEHAARFHAVGGPGVLGLGSDFDGIDLVPEGLEDAGRLPALVRGIRDRTGLDAEGLRGLCHANLLRVFAAWE